MAGSDSPDSSVHNSSGAPREDGLPAVAPDWFEQEHPEEIDNSVPTRGYDMLPVVGLGGSAGSIPVLRKFFEKMPAESGMAFVVIVHLAPEHDSILAEMLGRATTMRVVQATNGEKLRPNTVYVTPPGKHLTLGDGGVRLTPIDHERGVRVAVDVFLRSLADTHGPHGMAIILSGGAGDGMLGIKRLKERGGLTVAQAPEEAEQPSMPRSAIETGMVDWVLRVEEMPARLLQYRNNEQRLQLPSEEGPQPAAPLQAADANETALREVLAFLRTRTGHDFSPYKRGTVVRRISRRMQVNNALTVGEYLNFLRTHPGEAGALQQDLLISVTNFFRDRDAFAALEAEIPSLFVGKDGSNTIRAWVAACATGEEAYSVAMLLMEQASRMSSPPSIQVFATDLDENAIITARHGLYPAAMEADVSEERLRRFFVKEHRGYRARRELRECVLFATHDLLKDSPFSRMDLITCRNLLIYLTREAQARALDIFHFALKPYSLLFLGTSESIEDENRRFTVVDKKHRVFRQKEAPRAAIIIPGGPPTMARLVEAKEHARSGAAVFGKAFSGRHAGALGYESQPVEPPRASWDELHFKLIERYAPPSLIVTRDYDIVHVSENAGRFIQMRGTPSMNLLQVVHPALRIELRAALFQAAQMNLPAEAFRVPVEMEGKTVAVDIRVAPAQEIAPDHLLVVFAVREASESEAVHARVEAEPAVRHLDRENEQLKTRLRNTIEEYEASLEESKLANEEQQAMNEELRSAGEELETSREELQSVNEELTTVNVELKTKVDELALSNSDLNNLMAASGVATIFLDRELRIKRYTPSAVELFRLIPSDVDRPLSDLTHGLDYPDLRFDAERVLQTFVPIKREIAKEDGRWFLAQLLPYRSSDDRIMGVVLSFVDITESRKAQEAQRESEERLRFALEAANLYAWEFDAQTGRTAYAPSTKRVLGFALPESLEDSVALIHPDDRAIVAEKFENALRESGRFDAEFRFLHPETGEEVWQSSHGVFRKGPEGSARFVGITQNVTERRRAEEALRANEEQFRRAIEDAPIPVIVHAEDGQVLQISKIWTELTGYTREDLPSFEAWLTRAYGPGAEQLRAEVHRLFEGTLRQLETELEVTTRSGALRCWAFSASAPGILRDGRRFVVGMALDVTERRTVESALRESQERLRLVVENAREYAIFSMDLDRRITSWNAGAQAILGFNEKEVIGRPADIIFTPEDCENAVPEAEARTARAAGRADDERWHLRKDGSRFWGSGVMTAMRDAQGTAIGLVKIFRDQTKELLAKEALEKSRQELQVALQETERARGEAEAAGRAKDRFLAVLSHELRTPLTPIIMGLRMVTRDKTLSQSAREALAMIERNVTLEAHFIDDLLDVTRISNGKLDLVLEPMDLHETIKSAVEVSQPDINAKRQEVTVALDASNHQLSGDTRRLQQVFWNLFKNASKFTPEGGRITIGSRNEPGLIVVTVCDTGVGFEPEAGERIFTAFEQASPAVTREYGGLGLGLAISKATVEGHGGRIRAESAGRNQGATFVVELPLRTSE